MTSLLVLIAVNVLAWIAIGWAAATQAKATEGLEKEEVNDD